MNLPQIALGLVTVTSILASWSWAWLKPRHPRQQRETARVAAIFTSVAAFAFLLAVLGLIAANVFMAAE